MLEMWRVPADGRTMALDHLHFLLTILCVIFVVPSDRRFSRSALWRRTSRGFSSLMSRASLASLLFQFYIKIVLMTRCPRFGLGLRGVFRKAGRRW